MTYNPQNIFARIIQGQLPCNKVYEDKDIIAFHDLHPAAPIHVLILPKGQYCSFDDFVSNAGSDIVKSFYLKIREIANGLGLAKTGYRLIMNHGPDACQTVEHYHVHLLGKCNLGPLVAEAIHHA